jgi:hypothetical protein
MTGEIARRAPGSPPPFAESPQPAAQPESDSVQPSRRGLLGGISALFAGAAAAASVAAESTTATPAAVTHGVPSPPSALETPLRSQIFAGAVAQAADRKVQNEEAGR